MPHLKFLGINTIYIGPLFQSTSHGYDAIDYFKIDRRLGTNDTFKDFVDSASKK
ncbi:alpha-amylase family glycosyl hydrolase [Clostridium hydrogenum]|uniref:alpha-amylase family glycosyl hydrolase n=1 Tax=Clostridium hydrogenum TaxID=2855764 RepID=UPI002E36C55C|nr:alpha-amylase family glycosyl hydrolase [Clostridium hydrogenum]